MSFLFKVKLDYQQFINEAQKFNVPLKFFTVNLGLVAMYVLIPIGSSGLMYLYFCEETLDEEKAKATTAELKKLGFIQVESFEIPLP